MARLSKAFIAGLIAGALGLAVSLSPFGLDVEEQAGLDLLFQLRGPRHPPSDVVVITLDRASAEALDLPPQLDHWPRSLHARLTELLARQKPAVIAFDIVFDQTQSAEDDARFAEAIRNAGNVVLAQRLIRDARPLRDFSGNHKATVQIERLVSPTDPISASAAALAPFPLPKVPVKISQFWTFKPGASDTPSLPVVAFQMFAKDACPQFIDSLKQAFPSLMENLQDGRGQGGADRCAEKLVRTLRELFQRDPEAAHKILRACAEARAVSPGHANERILSSLIRMYQGPSSRYLNFYGPPGTIRTVRYTQVLDGGGDAHLDPEPESFRNKAVFIGFSDLTQQDQRDGFHTVFSQSTGVDLSGVEIAATAFANLVENLAIQPLSPQVLGATVYLWGFTLGVLSFFLSTWLSAAAVSTLSLLYGVFCHHQFSSTGIWFPLVVPVFFQAPLAFFGSVLWKYFDTDRERKTVRKALGYFLPEQTVHELALHLPDIRKASQMVYATCLCTDVEKYTAIAEKMEPKELRALMNDYFGAVFAPVRHHGGIVSDVKGDSMLALWPAPCPDPAVRRKTCLAALDIAAAVRAFNRLLETRVHPQAGVPQFPTRIGLDAGRMSIGTIGALDHYEYRAVGSAVNTAERIESLNKHLGTRILASEEVLSQIEGFLMRELGNFLLIGKASPVAVHELICREEESSELQRRLCTRFAGALQAFRRRAWEEAIGEFSGCMKIRAQDGPSLFYIHLCEAFRANPPGEDWDGVVRLDRK